jgi:hypothetical protein
MPTRAALTKGRELERARRNADGQRLVFVVADGQQAKTELRLANPP